MGDLDSMKEVVKQTSELSQRGQHREALKIIDAAISETRWENRIRSMIVLSRHAAAISEALGDLQSARDYCEQIISCDSENALAQYALADVLFRQGRAEQAKQHALKSYELVVHSNTVEAVGLLELIMQNWPELRSPRQDL